MKKSDLKNGMIVKFRNSDELHILISDVFCDIKGEGFLELSSYNDEMCSIYDAEWDIVEVYKSKKSNIMACFIHNEIELIWKRNEVDWSKVPIDTKILVSIDGDVWKTRHFAKYEDNKIYVFKQGCTSWTAYGETNSWNYCELAEELKEEINHDELKNEYLKHMEGCECDVEEVTCVTEWLTDYYNVTRK